MNRRSLLRFRTGISALFLAVLLSGCATYQTNVESARDAMARREYDVGIKTLEPLANKEGDDQLIYVFDLASALQIAGQYSESNKYFHLADKLSDLKNYLSLSKQGLSLLLSEEYTQYKGEDFERLLLNVFSAINYMMLRDRESALVEIRRLNEKIEFFRQEQNKSYQQNTAAMYISALLWEADKNWASAYIDYERAYKRDSSINLLRDDLVRLAKKAQRDDQFDKWKKQFNITPKPEWSDKSMGEIVLVYQQGWGPRKSEAPRIATAYGFVSPGFPKLEPVLSRTSKAQLEIYNESVSNPLIEDAPTIKKVESQLIYDIEATSIKTLDDSYAPLIAKRIAAYVAKEAAASAIASKNEGLGALVGLALHITDRADLRQWSMLPQTLQVARVMIKPGRYKVVARGLDRANLATGENMEAKDIVVKPGEKVFINWRSFN